VIVIEFNNNGYSITGDGIDIKMSCVPNKFWDPVDQLYVILTKALCQVKNSKSDIICYNDSRIIDELNGNIIPILDTSQIFYKSITRELLPTIRGVVFFRKRPVSIKPYERKTPPLPTFKKINNTIAKFKKRWFSDES
jgi:hypothetical protein